MLFRAGVRACVCFVCVGDVCVCGFAGDASTSTGLSGGTRASLEPPHSHPRLPTCRRRYGEEVVGFRYVASGPLVRSSYRAGEFFTEAMIGQDRAASTAAGSTSEVGAGAGGGGGDAEPALDVGGVRLPVPEL